MTPRFLTVADVDAAMQLSTAAGWNQTPEDWRRIIALEPEGCFGIDVDGQLVATATLLCFGQDLAWVGMVLTHRDHQRKGLARTLMRAAIDTARRRGVRCIKLDATDQGRPLYSSLGFVDEQPIERWRTESIPLADARGSESVALSRDREGAVGIPQALDRTAFNYRGCGSWVKGLPNPERACRPCHAPPVRLKRSCHARGLC